jgi:multidrug resistance efflux pump
MSSTKLVVTLCIIAVVLFAVNAKAGEPTPSEKAVADAKAALEEAEKAVADAKVALEKAEKTAANAKVALEKAEQKAKSVFRPGPGYRVVWSGAKNRFIDIHVEQTPTSALLVVRAHNFVDADNATKRINEIRDQAIKDWHANGTPYKMTKNREQHESKGVFIRTIEFQMDE